SSTAMSCIATASVRSCPPVTAIADPSGDQPRLPPKYFEGTLVARTRSFEASASAITTEVSAPLDGAELRTNAMRGPTGDQPTPENTCVASFRGVPPRNGTRHRSG